MMLDRCKAVRCDAGGMVESVESIDRFRWDGAGCERVGAWGRVKGPVGGARRGLADTYDGGADA